MSSIVYLTYQQGQELQSRRSLFFQVYVITYLACGYPYLLD